MEPLIVIILTVSTVQYGIVNKILLTETSHQAGLSVWRLMEGLGRVVRSLSYKITGNLPTLKPEPHSLLAS